MPKLFREQDVEEANKILAGEAPEQAKRGVMTPAERIASIGRAYGAKAPVKRPDSMDQEAAALQELLGKDVKVERKKAGGAIRSASKRADGIAIRGKTKGRML